MGDWKAREFSRFVSGEYRRLPWEDEEWWVECGAIHVDHYAHLSVERDSKIAFTVDAAKGAADRQTRMKPGRYLNRYFGGVLSPERIRDLASTIDLAEGTIGYEIAMTPDDIEQVYRDGPRSCMSGEKAHSCSVYGAGDLGVAYVGEGDDISARVLVWPAKKIYSRVYGDDSRLVPLLREAGYSSAGRMGFAGARLLRVEHENSGAYDAPYFDGNERASVSECGEFFILGADGDSLGSTSGLIGGTCCHECGEVVDEDDSVYALENTWCESCAQDSLFYCEGCDEYAHNDDAVHVRGCDSYYCSYCADNVAFSCVGCNEYNSNDDCHIVDGDSLCETCFDDSGATECEECGNSSTSCVTVHTEGEATMACESCAGEYWTECDECGEWRHDTQDWKRGCESCDECTPPLSDGAEEILANSNESFEECGRLLLTASAASLASLDASRARLAAC